MWRFTYFSLLVWNVYFYKTDAETLNSPSFGTLVRCEDTGICLWANENSELVESKILIRELMRKEELNHNIHHDVRRRLETHVMYLEDVMKHTNVRGFKLPYRIGLTPRHLYEDRDNRISAEAFVHREHTFENARKLQETTTTPIVDPNNPINGGVTDAASGVANMKAEGEAASVPVEIPSSLNWCSTNNPKGKSVCTAIKSQQTCGSCWAFAATDAIETAVAITANVTPTALSPQQFLDCSNRESTETFTYCWAQKGQVPGATFMENEMRWGSTNDGCNGGMTHGAFMDAAQLQLGLLSDLDLPYREKRSTNISDTEVANGSSNFDIQPVIHGTCERAKVEHTAASISGWEQAVGKSCEISSNPVELLKLALQNQPISVAVNSGGLFKDYTGGLYSCPNNGDFSSSSEIDHAILLVGYGKESDGVGYWILKNSYSAHWGDKGFLHLRQDDKINCGVNVFPVIPLGAQAGARPVVEGGGEKVFLGMSFQGWIALAVVVSIASVVLTVIGLILSTRSRAQVRQ